MRILLFACLLLISSCALAKRLEAGVTFYQLPKAGATERVAYRFATGGGWRDAKARAKWAERPLYDYRVAPWGKIRIESRLLRGGKTAARVAIEIPSRADTRFDVHSEVRSDDPTRGCFGCAKPAMSAPIAGSATDRLWLWYGWNGISHAVIF